MLIETRSGPLRKLYAANVTTAGTSIANPADVKALPSFVDTGLIEMGPVGGPGANGLELIPFGTDTAAQTFLMSVFALDMVSKGDANEDSFAHYLLCSFTCTLCTSAGLANTAVNASQLYCGTITLGVGNANVDNVITSPTGNIRASVRVDTGGATWARVLLAINASAVSANVLYRKV